MSVTTWTRIEPDILTGDPQKDLTLGIAAELADPLWLLGHTATSENRLILDWSAGEPLLSEDYMRLFAINSKPQGDLSAYPPVEEILSQMSQVHKAALRYVRDLPAADFAARPRIYDRMPERAKALFPTRAHCIMGHITHEANHIGQLSYLRRLLGKPYRV